MFQPAVIHHPVYRSHVTANRRFPGNKYELLWEELGARGLASRCLEPEAAPDWWIALAHDSAYVQAATRGELTAPELRRIGLDWSADLIERIRYSIGGSVLAGATALSEGIALNSAGGSHHAASDAGSGYCIFNDVAVAARVLQARGLAQTFLVVDLDVHQGDGTAEIFRGDASVFTFSMHCEKNFPARKQQSDLDVSLAAGLGDADYLRQLYLHLEPLIEKLRPDLVFYNAGVDPHKEDKLGLLNISDEGLFQRDYFVIETCRRLAQPLAAVLGGGYDEDKSVIAARHLLLFQAANDAWGRESIERKNAV